MNNRFVKFILAGLINTGVGYGFFLIFHRLLDINPELSNAAGYGLGLITAFILNKIFVFNRSTFAKSTIPKFITAFVFAFAINQAVLIFFYSKLGVVVEISQLFAMASYTVLFYILNKKFVFVENG